MAILKWFLSSITDHFFFPSHSKRHYSHVYIHSSNLNHIYMSPSPLNLLHLGFSYSIITLFVDVYF